MFTLQQPINAPKPPLVARYLFVESGWTQSTHGRGGRNRNIRGCINPEVMKADQRRIQYPSWIPKNIQWTTHFSQARLYYMVLRKTPKNARTKKQKKKKRAVWSLTTCHIRNRVFVTNSQANDWVHCWVNHPGRNPGDVRSNQNPNGNHGQTQMQSYYLRLNELTVWCAATSMPKITAGHNSQKASCDITKASYTITRDSEIRTALGTIVYLVFFLDR